MKIYLVEEHYNNGEHYEDNYTGERIIKAFPTEQSAINFIKQIDPMELAVKSKNILKYRDGFKEVKVEENNYQVEKRDDGESYYTEFEKRFMVCSNSKEEDNWYDPIIYAYRILAMEMESE